MNVTAIQDQNTKLINEVELLNEELQAGENHYPVDRRTGG